MFNARKLIGYTFLVAIAILILICVLAFIKTDEKPPIGYEIPIYMIPISESTQRDIWEQCEKNHLSYELVLAIFQVEDNNILGFSNIKAEVEKLVYFRDYWTKQGFPDEIVFNLMLLSRTRGIEGCIIFMKDNDSYDLDNYVQEVVKYKYYLEQIDIFNESSEI